MFNSRWVLLAALVSTSSFAGPSLQTQKMRVESLMKMKLHAPMMALEAYQRELRYEELGLSNEARAKSESNLLAEKIRQQVHTAYAEALEQKKNTNDAREEIRAAIEADLEMAAPELKEELLNLALNTLDNVENGASSESVDLPAVEQAMEREVMNRRSFLNASETFVDDQNDPIQPKANPNKDSEKKDYKSKAELIESLVSDRESSRWVSTGGQTIKTAQAVKTDAKISLQVKMEFLGATIEAGPSISFSREISTDAQVMAEGFAPVIKSDGSFDRVKRDRNNAVEMKNGKVVPRYIAFYCDADLKFQSESTLSGGLKYMGLGADATVSSTFQNSVTIQSRRIALPESVQGKMMTVKYLTELCHKEFLKGRYSNSSTVGQALTTLMRNVVAGLVYSNPKTKCIKDTDCAGWYKNEVISLNKKNNVARCVEHKVEKYRFCQLRGKVGQSCPVFEDGKRTSSGEREFQCDWGLRCVKNESSSYLGSWKVSSSAGTCQK